MEAISAIEAIRPIMKNHTAIVHQMMPAVPLCDLSVVVFDTILRKWAKSYPLRSPGQFASKVHSQVA